MWIAIQSWEGWSAQDKATLRHQTREWSQMLLMSFSVMLVNIPGASKTSLSLILRLFESFEGSWLLPTLVGNHSRFKKFQANPETRWIRYRMMQCLSILGSFERGRHISGGIIKSRTFYFWVFSHILRVAPERYFEITKSKIKGNLKDISKTKSRIAKERV